MGFGYELGKALECFIWFFQLFLASPQVCWLMGKCVQWLPNVLHGFFGLVHTNVLGWIFVLEFVALVVETCCRGSTLMVFGSCNS